MPPSPHRALVAGFVLLAATAPLGAAEINLSDLAFTGLPPCRVLDTRPGSGGPGQNGPLVPGTPYAFNVTGVCGVPAEARAAVLNFVAVGPGGAGHLTVWPYDSALTTPPNTSVINFVPGQNIANGVVVPLCDDATATDNTGADCDSSLWAAAGVSAVHLVVDVLGYFAAPGYGRMWGAGRPGAMRHGQDYGSYERLCSRGTVRFGLSQVAVAWGEAASACPAGTWVCTGNELAYSSLCDTTRLDSACDRYSCDGTCLDDPLWRHSGWVADSFGKGGEDRTEFGDTGGTPTCNLQPVWCCSR